jgi:hypothetical protein
MKWTAGEGKLRIKRVTKTSTAFSPPGAMMLSRRAKILMMIRAMISWSIIALPAARREYYLMNRAENLLRESMTRL